MREFFHSWRRKFGVMTLVMALLFTVGWVRSVTIDEGVSFRTGKFTDMFLGSGPSGFVVALGKYSDASFPSLNSGWFSKKAVADVEAEEQGDWQWTGGGFQFRTSGNGNFSHMIAPYWSIVVPLTLLSTCMLLTKPRRRKESGEALVTTINMR